MWDSVVAVAEKEERIEAQRFGPVLATAFGSHPEIPCLNRIQGAGEPGAVDAGHLNGAIEWMRAREVDYSISVAQSRPGSERAEAWLASNGYECGDSWTKFIYDIDRIDLPENPDIEVFELSEESSGEAFSWLAREGLGLPIMVETLFFALPVTPRWRCYTAAPRLQDQVVSCGAMRIEDGVAQLGLEATLAGSRGRGCNTALLRRRLLDAAEAGCSTAFVELGGRGGEGLAATERNLRAVGFVEAYADRAWRRPVLAPSAVPA